MFSAQSRLRHAVADTFAMVVYCTVVNMMIEIFLSGMTFEQSLSSRLVAIPVNIIIAVPYGFYRDRAMRLARHISPSGWMKNIADVVAYVTFQSPVYVAILFVVGADWHQIAAAVSSNIVVSMLMGAAYGYFLDYCRRLFRVSARPRPEPVTNQRLARASR
ncbi:MULTISPECIES: L-alanine exporter AlaE [unclassified Raoultella]|uniref:L-alanine exporter AlaE n=1 Tax=unclassified Raoultella TaxID=2627600 RepID=UPI0013578DC4|nr:MULTISPECIES: L-alanine exporter AlaE [unclassified Raoultella]